MKKAIIYEYGKSARVFGERNCEVMQLSIVTINYNDAAGLKRTLDSVASQSLATSPIELEHIIIDGGSTDGSVDVIHDYESSITNQKSSIQLRWISESDKGIYNAMNKGILMASGDYIQVLNSGDVLASPTVIEDCRMKIEELGYPELMYGNMIKQAPDGTIIGKSGEVPYSLLQYFTSTINHDCCWIKRSLFVPDNHQSSIINHQCYGLYDENLKIVSDWKWFLQAIGLGKVQPIYVDIDMTIFDTSGISERNLQLRNEERRKVLEEMLPPAVLADYDRYAFPMHQYNRLKKYHLWGLVYFVERVFFKLEKWHILK